MPTANKIRWAELKVGLVAVAALVLVGILVFLLTGSTNIFARKANIYTYFNDANSMGVNADVALNGIRIGKIKQIVLSGDNRAGRIVRIKMEIDEKSLANLPVDSVATVSSANVLGTKFINIKKGQSGRNVQPEQEIPSQNQGDFDEFVAQGNRLLVQAQGILQRIDNIVGLVESGQGSIGKILKDEDLYNRIINVVAQVQKLANTLNSDKGTLGKLIYDDALYTDVRREIGQLDKILLDIQAGKGTAGKLLYDTAVYDEAQQNLAQLRKLLEDLNAGKGTAGKLLKDDRLANELNATLGKVNTTIDRLNAGQGTIGQLLVNQSLYDNINGTTTELHGLLKDFRANPKKFLRIKLSLF